MKKYSFWKGLYKTLINVAIVAVPMAVNLLPAEWANLTLSGALLMLVNYFKVKVS